MFLKTLNAISALSIIVPLGVILMNFFFYRTVLFNVFIYVLVGFLFEAYDGLIFIVNHSNKVSTNIYTLFETLTVAWIYHSFIKDKTAKAIIVSFAALYALLWLGVMSFDSFESSSSLINGGSSLVCILFGVLFFFQSGKESELKNIQWKLIIGGAFLFYFVANAGVFSFTKFFSDLHEKKYWIYFAVIHFIANVGLNSLLALGLYQCRKQSLQA